MRHTITVRSTSADLNPSPNPSSNPLPNPLLNPLLSPSPFAVQEMASAGTGRLGGRSFFGLNGDVGLGLLALRFSFPLFCNLGGADGCDCGCGCDREPLLAVLCSSKREPDTRGLKPSSTPRGVLKSSRSISFLAFETGEG